MRRDARVVAFQLIFEKLFTTQNEYDEEFISSLKKSEDMDFAKQILSGFEQNSEDIKTLVASKLVGYEVGRVYRADLALLYMAVAEIKYVGTPKQVVINETIEIAKIYSTDKSARFINGVLSSIVKGEQ